jgi:hypothetical protein
VRLLNAWNDVGGGLAVRRFDVRLLNAWNDVGGSLALRRFGVRLLNRVYFAPRVYPPPRVVCDFVENPYMIFDVCITIISGRNKYLKISESRQMRLAS